MNGIEKLVAAAAMVKELSDDLVRAVMSKWSTLSREFNEVSSSPAYLARAAELERCELEPVREALERAREQLEGAASSVRDKNDWPAGNTAHARASALARVLEPLADADVVELKLEQLRSSGRVGDPQKSA